MEPSFDPESRGPGPLLDPWGIPENRRSPEDGREKKRKDARIMSEGHDDQLVGFVAGLLLGAAIGATAALLSAPQSGRRTRRRLGRAAVEIRKSSGDRWDDVAEEVRNRVDDALQGARKRLSSE